MTKIIFFSLIVCALALHTESYAQENGLYHVIVVNGRIVNQQSGLELRSDAEVYLHTMLLFGSATDNAVLRSPSQRRYRLVPPEELLASSNVLLREIKSRPMVNTSLRSVTRRALAITPELLGAYFGADTFAIIGNHLKIDVDSNVTENADLVFRFTENNTTREIVSNDFVIRQNDMGGRTQINDCLILLREGDKLTPVTKVTLLFVDEQNLHREFAAWLNGLEKPVDKRYEIRRELQEYCRDVYGVMDNTMLNNAINSFF